MLGVGLIGGAVTGSWLTGEDRADRAVSAFVTAGELWHSVPVDQLFPPTVQGQGAGPGGADRTWTRIAVAPDSGCANAFDPLLSDVLAPVGCQRLLRATYTDATQSYVTTVGILFTKADISTMTALSTRFKNENLANRTDLMPRPYAAKGTLAAGFGDKQRASWTVSVLTDAPVVVYAVSGWADGRKVDVPEPADEAVTSGGRPRPPRPVSATRRRGWPTGWSGVCARPSTRPRGPPRPRTPHRPRRRRPHERHVPPGRAGERGPRRLAGPRTLHRRAHADGIRDQEWALDAMHTQEVWQTTKGKGITVAVLDTGVEADHPDLTGNVLPGKDMVGFGARPGDRSWARHGTAMVSIIAGHGHGPGDTDGVIGIAPEAKILPVRVILEDGDSARGKARTTRGNALADGIRWAADHGADVINLSLGDDSASAHPEPAEDEAVQYALKKGVAVVASAGNGGEKGDHVSYPAAYPGVIAATAVDRFGTRASFSTRRWYATVSAPGSTSSSPTPTTSTTRGGGPAPHPPLSQGPLHSSRPPTRG